MIKIVEEGDITLTQEQYDALLKHWELICHFSAGEPPSFEDFVRARLAAISNDNQG